MSNMIPLLPRDDGADWCRVEAKAPTAEQAETVAEVHIYDEIGYWGTSAKDFAQQLAELDVDRIQLRINSPGGNAWDGVAIMNTLRRHRARVEVTVDGIAASAASLIAMAGDHIVMNRSSQMMIHDTSGMAWGNAATMRETADLLDKLSDSYADAYAKRAGGSRGAWRDVMRAETWYTAEEAVLAGLADAWDGSDSAEAAARPVNLSRFRYPGRAAAPAPAALMAAHVSPASPEPGSTQKKEEDAMSYESLTAGLRERLGITEADTPEDGILAALDEALSEQAAVAHPTAEVVLGLPEGVVAVEAAVLEELRANVAELQGVRDAQAVERRARLVDAAVADGRIPPARREHWLTALAADEEGMAPVLASLAPNTVPLVEIGHAADSDDADATAYPAHWKR